MEPLFSLASSSSVPLLVFCLLLCLPSGNPANLSSDRAALLSLRSTVGGRTVLWNATRESPCQWAGVQCENGRVTALRLPGVSLSGELPVGTVGSLTELQTLSLRFNSLSGNLPSDLASCVNLRNLYLQENRFSGPLPEFLSQLSDLVRLDLAGNNFSGEIPLSFSNLKRLRTMYLEDNRLAGSIPDLDLSSLNQFNVSFNQLDGPIPKFLQSKPTNSFIGNSLCGPPLDSCNVTPSTTGSTAATTDQGKSNKKKKKLSGGAIAGIVVGSVLGFLLFLFLLLFLYRKKGAKKTSSIDVAAIKHLDKELSSEKPQADYGTAGNGYSSTRTATEIPLVANGKSEVGSGVGKQLVFFGSAGRVFDLEDLLRASAEVLGKGTFGTAYKAVLEAGNVVAVKRLKDVTMPEREFREKIEAVGDLGHENLVPLRAYYYNREEKLLVYDYLPTGSLSALLHGMKGSSRTPLNWQIRSAIALGAARGIEHIHSQGPTVSHGNIKSSNILLTKSYEARVSDFGMAQLVGPSSTPTQVVGYRAPEVTDPRKVTRKADVYSFGVLLLELLTGKAPTHALLNEEGVDLPRWVQSVVREEWTSEVFDLELLRYHNVEEEMIELLQLGINCADPHPDKRPSISEVVSRVEQLRHSSIKDAANPQPDIASETD